MSTNPPDRLPPKPSDLVTLAETTSLIDDNSLVLFNYKGAAWNGYFSILSNNEIFYSKIFDKNGEIGSKNVKKKIQSLEQKINGRVHEGFIIETDEDQYHIFLGMQDLYGAEESNKRKLNSFKQWLNIVQSQELYDNIGYEEIFGVDCVVASSQDHRFHYVAGRNNTIDEYMSQDLRDLNLSKKKESGTLKPEEISLEKSQGNKREWESTLPGLCFYTNVSELDIKIKKHTENIYKLTIISEDDEYTFYAPVENGQINLNFGPHQAFYGCFSGTIDHETNLAKTDLTFWNKLSVVLDSKKSKPPAIKWKLSNVKTFESIGQNKILSTTYELQELDVNLKLSVYIPNIPQPLI